MRFYSEKISNVSAMCPLSNLIYLMDSYKQFTKVTKTKVEEYNSCRVRYEEYLTTTVSVRDGHLVTCPRKDEYCCREYLYNTVPSLIDEILESIAVPYIINFRYEGDGDFIDMSCSTCYWDRENFKMIHSDEKKLVCTDFFLTKKYKPGVVWELLRRFDHFTKITNTKTEEYNSCSRRFYDYCTLMHDAEDNHLDICEYFGVKEITTCDCLTYMKNTLPSLVQEIMETIAVPYIINFTRPDINSSQVIFC